MEGGTRNILYLVVWKGEVRKGEVRKGEEKRELRHDGPRWWVCTTRARSPSQDIRGKIPHVWYGMGTGRPSWMVLGSGWMGDGDAGTEVGCTATAGSPTGDVSRRM